jgi:hypothetical protein
MINLDDREKLEIARAEHDGAGWAMSLSMPDGVRESLKLKGLIRFRENRWQLTPLGFAQTGRFQGF